MSNVIYMVKDKPLKEIIKSHLYEIYSKNEVDTFINATFDNMINCMCDELTKSGTISSVECTTSELSSISMKLSKDDNDDFSLKLKCSGIRSAKDVTIRGIKRIEPDKIFTIDRDEFTTEWEALIKALFGIESLKERLKEIGSINSITIHGSGSNSNEKKEVK